MLLHEPGPHVGARGESLLPDLHLFLEPSYIGMITNVSAHLFQAQPICEIECRQHGVTRVGKKKRKRKKSSNILCVSACKLHMQHEVFLLHSMMDKKQSNTLETTHTRFHKFNFWLHHLSLLHLAVFTILNRALYLNAE